MSEDATLDEFVSTNDITQQDSNQYLPEIDGIPNDWRLVAVDDISTDLIGGGTPTKSNEEYWNGNIPWASVKDLNGIELSETEDYITSAGVENSTTNIIPRFSVIISTRMTVGEPFLNQVQMAINQDMKGIIPDMEKIDPLFLVYSLWDKDQYLKSLGRGTTVDGITTKDLSLTHLGLPPLEEQRKIATVLHNVDQAIQKTGEVIEQAESAKQALMQTLFVEGYYEYDETVDAYHRNRLHQHPAEWTTKPAQDVIDVTRGAHPRPKSDDSLWRGDIPIIKIGDRNRGDNRTIESTDETVTEKGSQRSKIVDEETLIVSNAGTVGTARITGMETCIHDHWLILRNYEENLTTRFLYYFINWNQNFLESLSSGSTVLDLNTDDFRLFDVTIPSLDEQQQITRLLDSLHDQKMMNIRYVEQLEHLKKALMQDLLSGKVRTTDTSIAVPDEIRQHG